MRRVYRVLPQPFDLTPAHQIDSASRTNTDEGSLTVAAKALYLKWRPKCFADVVGQDVIVQTLRNAVRQDKTVHAYLFSGPRGTGKTTTGRILAKAIILGHDDAGEPSADSPDAVAVDEGRHLDLIEIDAASNRKIDDIRELRERANYVPTSADAKVYLIDEAHQLTSDAESALLKTLEEPPPHVYFILATTDPGALKETIRSRCQRYDFRRVEVKVLAAQLRKIAQAEGISIDDDALRLLAREATGSVRDAVGLLDQVWATHGDTISRDAVVDGLGLSSDARALELAKAALAKDLKAGLAVIADAQDDAVDFSRFNKQVVAHLRHALLRQSGADESLDLSEPEADGLAGLAAIGGPADTAAALRAFGSADLRTDAFSALPLELALAGLVYAPAPAAAAAAPPARNGRRAAPARDGGGQRASGGGRPRPDEPAPTFRTPPPARTAPPPPGAAPAPAAGRPAAARKPAAATPARVRTPEEQLLAAIIAKLDQDRATKKHAAYLRNSCELRRDGDALSLVFRPDFQSIHKKFIDDGIAAVRAAAVAAAGGDVTLATTAAGADAAPPRSKLAAAAEAEGLKRVRARPG